MQFKALKQIDGKANPKKLSEENLLIKDAGGKDLGYKGTYLVPMQILGVKMMHDLVVLENAEDKILGINFICQQKLSFNSLSDKCFWETPHLMVIN
jgi:hypothetical protein